MNLRPVGVFLFWHHTQLSALPLTWNWGKINFVYNFCSVLCNVEKEKNTHLFFSVEITLEN
jgi:hypothetical protein